MKSPLTLIFTAVVVLMTACTPSAPTDNSISISVSNSGSEAYIHHPVIVDYRSVIALRPDWEGQSLSIVDPNGSVLASQIDDMDSDGTLDEIVFLYNFEPGTTITFQLQPGTPAPSPFGKTDARNWKRPGPDGELAHTIVDTFQVGQDKKWYRYDGPGWENELIGWRIYFDGRNATDIWGKRTDELFMERLGTSTENYEEDLPWGTDVLKVLNSVGIGGAGFWTGDSVSRPFQLDGHVATMVANGPLRTVYRIDYTGWQTSQGKADITSWHTLYADTRTNIHTILLKSGSDSLPFATGLVKHEAAPLTRLKSGNGFYTYGNQSIQGNGLMMSIHMHSDDIVGFSEDANSHLILFNLIPNEPVSIYASAQWEFEPVGFWDAEYTASWLATEVNRIEQPLTVTVE
jgi:hypothetical protein